MTDKIGIAYTIAKIAHAGQKYGGGEDYFLRHVCNVVARVRYGEHTEGHVIVAYLHDTVEDTVITMADLCVFGFDPEIIDAVAAITRKDGEDYLSEYIPRVKKNSLAAFVKYHDLKSNTNTGTKVSMVRRNFAAMKILKDF